MTEPTHFLNVDLEIYSKSNLEPLVSALGKKVLVLFLGRVKRKYGARLEVAKHTKNADSTIRAFCTLIESLPRAERRLWNEAKVRDFSIGVQAGGEPSASDFAIAVETLQATVDVGARIVLTIYAPEVVRQPSRKRAATVR